MKNKNIRAALIDFAEQLINDFDLPQIDVETSVDKFLEQREIQRRLKERAKILAQKILNSRTINYENEEGYYEYEVNEQSIENIILAYFEKNVKEWQK